MEIRTNKSLYFDFTLSIEPQSLTACKAGAKINAFIEYYSYLERRRDWPDEARQPVMIHYKGANSCKGHTLGR